WWDNETDGDVMYPKQPLKLTADQVDAVERRNPEGAATRGLWSNLDFLDKVGTPEFNAQLKHTQFGDYHSHGWILRNVYKQDRHGNMLAKDGQKIDFKDPDKFGKAVHLQDIHLEKGMHCVDC